MSPSIRVYLAIALALAFALPACGPTKFVSTWKNPGARPTSWQGQKIAAFVITPQRSIRLGAETALARELTERGAVGIAGHKVLPLDVVGRNDDRARETLESAGISGAVLMSVVGNDQKVNYSPGTVRYVGTYYPTFWGYWDYGWATVYQPGNLSMDTVVSVETRLYSVTDNQLLWAGTSRTTNPKSVQKFITDLSDAVAKEVRKAGLTASP